MPERFNNYDLSKKNASGDIADGLNDETVQTEYVLKGSKNVAELLKLDAEDESLRKYKEALLGGAGTIR